MSRSNAARTRLGILSVGTAQIQAECRTCIVLITREHHAPNVCTCHSTCHSSRKQSSVPQVCIQFSETLRYLCLPTTLACAAWGSCTITCTHAGTSGSNVTCCALPQQSADVLRRYTVPALAFTGDALWTVSRGQMRSYVCCASVVGHACKPFGMAKLQVSIAYGFQRADVM